MSDPTQDPLPPQPESKTEDAEPTELDDKALGRVSGGVRGGDDDLEDLEVERARRR